MTSTGRVPVETFSFALMSACSLKNADGELTRLADTEVSREYVCEVIAQVIMESGATVEDVKDFICRAIDCCEPDNIVLDSDIVDIIANGGVVHEEASE